MATEFTFTGAYIRPNFTRDGKLRAIQRYYDSKRTTPCYLLFLNTVKKRTAFPSNVVIDKALEYCDDDDIVILEIIAIEKYKDEEGGFINADESLLDEGGEDSGSN